MELKDYQVAALEAFVRWRDALAEARTEADETIAKLKSVDLAVPDGLPQLPQGCLGAAGRVRWRGRDRRAIREPHGRCRTAHPARLLQGADRRRQDPAGRRRVASGSTSKLASRSGLRRPAPSTSRPRRPSGTENIPTGRYWSRLVGGGSSSSRRTTRSHAGMSPTTFVSCC